MSYTENYESMEKDAKFVLNYLEKQHPDQPTYCKSVLMMASQIAKYKEDLWTEEMRQKQYEAQLAAQQKQQMEQKMTQEGPKEDNSVSPIGITKD
jgi:hypothetical protein